MQKVTEILFRAFLRRYPLPIRINLFGHLSQYVWLKDVLEELRPELLPPPAPVSPPAVAAGPRLPADRILGILERSAIRGQQGYYQAKTYLGVRGHGHLFSAIATPAQQPVIIKEYWLPTTQFTRTEALHRQNNFQRLAGLQLADGRSPDFRIILPIEAIADTNSQELCFLVTPALDQSPTLRQQLTITGSLPPDQVQEILSQILQTLDFLHRQKFHLPCGAMQNGLVHGNLSLDSLLWTEQAGQLFIYLCDLQLWEQYFDRALRPHSSTEATPQAIQQDLKAVGEIGIALLQGDSLSQLEPGLMPPPLRLILDSLRTGKYDSAETARCQLMQLTARSPTTLTPLPSPVKPPEVPAHSWSPLLLLPLLGLLVGAFLLVPRWRESAAQRHGPPVTTCCLAEVSAIPTGSFRYTALTGGTWWQVLQQRNLLQRNQGFSEQLARTQPKLNLSYVPATSFEEMFQQIQQGGVDFAVMPWVLPLPSDLMPQTIAYDGLATVVPFSYARRKQGLPTPLKGELHVAQVQSLFSAQITQWEQLGGPPLPVQRYLSNNPEVITIFEQKIMSGRSLQTLPNVRLLPSITLMRQVIRDFEEKDVGSIGITALSEAWGQCSIYPLALRTAAAITVQPLVLSNGQAITPETDLCDRKGAYAPDPDQFNAGRYPFSYPLVVVYPRNNRRAAMGKKFVELLHTAEGQQLLQAAGLIPLSRAALVRRSPNVPP